MDCGRDLGQCQRGPWLPGPSRKSTRLHPVFQHRPRMALSANKQAAPSSTLPTNGTKADDVYSQSIDHLRRNYGRHLRPEIMAHDAFYALTELFNFSASSVDQLLELIEDTIRPPRGQLDWPPLSELLIVKGYLDDYQNYVYDILDLIKARGNPKWPRAMDQKNRERADREANRLENRYQALLRRCQRLSQSSANRISIQTSFESHRQADQAMTQATRFGKLSFLAYIFVPISFAASFFGMNFAELGPQLSIWTFYAMAVPLLAISMVAWYFDVLIISLAAWRYLGRTLSNIWNGNKRSKSD